MTNRGKVAVLSLLALGVMMTKEMGPTNSTDTSLLKSKGLPRGLRNNNPLNLKKTAINWQDEINNPADAVFESFRTLAAGLRAGIRNAKGKWKKGKTTVEALVHVWAPPSENNTKAYVAAVAKSAGIAATARFEWTNTAVVARIIHAMCIHENGPIASQYLPLSFVQEQVKAVG